VEHNDRSATAYLDYSGRDDLLSGGVKLIPIETPKGPFRGLITFIHDVNAGRF
jgi:hypothetical protein